LGRGEEGAAHFRQALQLAEETGDHLGLARAYTNFTDALTMLGRLRESAGLGQAGLKAMRRYGINNTLLVANQIEALLAIGDWNEAERLSAAALRGITSSFPYWLLTMRAVVETGRGDYDAARAHLKDARATLREDRVHGLYDACLAELALWERRWTDADAAIQNGMAQACQRGAAHTASRCAPRDCAHRRSWRRSRAPAGTPAPSITGSPRRGSSSPWPAARPRRPQRSRRTPEGGWPWPRPSISGPAARRCRSRGHRQQRPGSGSSARRWWRTVIGARPKRSSQQAPPAPRRPCRCGRLTPLRPGSRPGRCSAKSSCSPSARGSISRPRRRHFPKTSTGPQAILGLTPRETQVLNLLACGYTNREIAAVLVISVKTASVHVSHILRKLGAPNRLEAAATISRLAPPPSGQPDPRA
jgi:DNA-binding CsgD family transcriptional regulator